MRLHPMASYTPSLSDFPATANSLPRDLSRTFFRHVIPHLQSTTFMGKGLNRGILLYPFTFYLVNRSAPDVDSLYRPDRSFTSSPDLSVPKRVFTQWSFLSVSLHSDWLLLSFQTLRDNRGSLTTLYIHSYCSMQTYAYLCSFHLASNS